MKLEEVFSHVDPWVIGSPLRIVKLIQTVVFHGVNVLMVRC